MFKNISFSITLFAFSAFIALASEDAKEAFELSTQSSWVNEWTYTNQRATLFNPENEILKNPTHKGVTELRPNFKLLYGSRLTAIARPRFKLFSKKIEQSNESQFKTEGEASLNEIYTQISLTDDIIFAYGKMNYQWGPAELLSPSNRLFQNIVMQPSSLYEYTGKDLARVNLTFEKHLNFILLGEIKMSHNTEAENHGDTLVLKTEYALREGADYFGLVVGRSREDKNWIGEYIAITPSDAFQFYLDASHTRGSKLPSAKKNALGMWQLTDSNRDKNQPESKAVLGTRYTSERGNELRIEGAYQTDGFTKTDLDNIQSSLKPTEPLHTLNLVKYYQAPTSLQGRLYGYLAYRVPDLDSKKKLQLTPRYLHSFQDHSGVFFVSTEYNLSNAWVTQLVTTYAHGEADEELSKNNRMSASAALQYSF